MNETKFEFKYDEEHDDLFIYLPNKKSKGAVEIGNFIFDFDEDENLVAMQILDASKVLLKLVTKVIEMTRIKEIQAQVINFRNMAVIKLDIILEGRKETITITIPRIKEKSPALSY